MKGRIFDLSRMCHRDGPGLRTTVFFKGCPLHCRWCHNPEGLSPETQVMATLSLCSQCGRCAAVCPHGCHRIDGENHAVDFTHCTRCGACVAACPNDVLRMAGYETDAESLADRIARDAPFFRYSGGGATLSGGEVLMQPAFALALLDELRARGIHTCVETSGYRADDAVLAVPSAADLILLDCKHTDEAELLRWTGLRLSAWTAFLDHLEKAGKPVILRCPLIPTVNMTPEHAAAIGRILEEHDCILHAELLPYHELGQHKGAGFNRETAVFPVPTDVETADFAARVRAGTRKDVRIL